MSPRLTKLGRIPTVPEHHMACENKVLLLRDVLHGDAPNTGPLDRIMVCEPGKISSWLGFQRWALALWSICYVCWVAVVHLGLYNSSWLTCFLCKEDANCSDLSGSQWELMELKGGNYSTDSLTQNGNFSPSTLSSLAPLPRWREEKWHCICFSNISPLPSRCLATYWQPHLHSLGLGVFSWRSEGHCNEPIDDTSDLQ